MAGYRDMGCLGKRCMEGRRLLFPVWDSGGQGVRVRTGFGTGTPEKAWFQSFALFSGIPSEVARFSSDGLPMSPGGSVVRPPPGSPPMSPRDQMDLGLGSVGLGHSYSRDRPEKPAKYIYELPKLGAADLGSSAVAFGNWMAQIR